MKEIQETFKDDYIEKIIYTSKVVWKKKMQQAIILQKGVNTKSSDFNINCEVAPIQITVLTNLRPLMRKCN